jgi:capsular polysaccharide biosynthesis protein
MSSLAEVFFRHRSIETLGAAGLLGPGKPVQHAHSLPPSRIRVPPLSAGRLFLEQWQSRELPDQEAWRQGYYDSVAPPIFVLHDVLVHSSAGIIAVGDQVITETLSHTRPEVQGYRTLAKGIAIKRQTVRHLTGVHISALAAGDDNYYHSILLGLARLAAVPENYQAAAAGLLVPRGGARQREMLALMDLMPSMAVHEVGPQETLHVETLILPLSVAGDSAYHPCVADFFRRISTGVPPAPKRLPRRLYIDRRGSPIRPLVNEDALVGALCRLGFVAVRPELFSVQDQIRLFRGAEAIVAPHGAGLTNLGFCRPGCLVIELLMDAYANWCFRHLAALMQLNYDCVLGRARRPWGELNLAFHGTPWEISVNHVVAAAAQSVEHSVAA